MREMSKKVIYISGPITGVDNYWEAFEQAEEDLISIGYIPLSPARLPQGMTKEQYMRIDFAMMDSADAVLFLHGYAHSEGCQLELQHCVYTGKPVVFSKAKHFALRIAQDHLRSELKEVLGV